MSKIADLTNAQLLLAIQKRKSTQIVQVRALKKVINEINILEKEREKRTRSGINICELYSKEEVQKIQKEEGSIARKWDHTEFKYKEDNGDASDMMSDEQLENITSVLTICHGTGELADYSRKLNLSEKCKASGMLEKRISKSQKVTKKFSRQ